MKRIFLSLGILVIGIILFGFSLTPRNFEAQVSFLDVGQGDSIFIESSEGFQMIIDGGRDKKVLRELPDVMKPGDRSIDVLLATHPDADHIGGLVDVLRNYEVKVILLTEATSDTAVWRAFWKEVQNENAIIVYPKRGERLFLGTIIIDILYPYSAPRGGDTNASSLITKISFGETSVMLTGDAPLFVENILVSREKESLDADILKLGHHGSRTSTGASFLSFVSPSIAIVSAGKDNTYGHPHTEVLSLLESFSIPVLATYEEGTIQFISDGNSFRRVK